MWRPLIHQTTCANTFIRMGLSPPPTNNSALEEVQEQRLTGQKTESWVGATLDWKFACKMGTVCERKKNKNKATTSWGILVNSFQINGTFVCRLRMENILQQSWRLAKHRFDPPNRKLLCVQLHSCIPLAARPSSENCGAEGEFTGQVYTPVSAVVSASYPCGH